MPGPSVYALIPARRGSKGIPRKNFQKILGKTLVEISILLAGECKEINEIYLSTDDQEIARLGKTLGAQVIIRPDEYSTDSSRANDVVNHFIDVLELRNTETAMRTIIVYLQPTSPFRTETSIRACINSYRISGEPSLTIRESPTNSHKLLTIKNDGRIATLIPGANPTSNRQELERNFIATGEVYVFSVEDFLKLGDIPVVNAIPIFSDSRFNLDIDSPSDLEIAQIYGERNGF